MTGTERLGQPLKSVSPSLYAALNAAAEVDQGVKERTEKLLESA